MKITNNLPIILLFLAPWGVSNSLLASQNEGEKQMAIMGKQPVMYMADDAGQPPVPKEPIIRATPKNANDGHDNIWELGNDYSFEDAMVKAFFAVVDGGEWVGKKLGLVASKKQEEGEEEKGDESKN